MIHVLRWSRLLDERSQSVVQESRGTKLDSRGGCRGYEERRVWAAFRVIWHALAGLIRTPPLRHDVARCRTHGRTIPRRRTIHERTATYRTAAARHAVSRRKRASTVVSTTIIVVPLSTGTTTTTFVATTATTVATISLVAASLTILRRSLALIWNLLLSMRNLLLILLLVRLRSLLLLETFLNCTTILILAILLRGLQGSNVLYLWLYYRIRSTRRQACNIFVRRVDRCWDRSTCRRDRCHGCHCCCRRG